VTIFRAVFVSAVLALAPLGAQGAAKTLTIGVQTGVTSLDARQATDAASGRILRLVTMGLVDLDDQQQPIPKAARRIEQTDPLTYTLWLGDHTFHDGTVLTAHHVKHLYDTIRDPKSASPLRGLYAVIEDIRAPADDMLVFTLKKPNPFFWNLLLRPLVKLNPDGTAPALPVGIGPYHVTQLTDSGDVTLTLAPTWRGTPPALERIRFKTVPDPLVRLLKLRKGELDMLQNDIPEVFFDYALRHGMVGVTGPSATYTYIGFNLQDTLTGRLEVRQALAHAIDRQTMMETLLGGRAQPALSVLPASHPAYWPAPQAAYDPAKAEALLDAAGLPRGADGMRFRLTFSTTNTPSLLLLAQVLQAQLKEVGIDLKINTAEWGTFYGNIRKGNFQMFLLSWVGLFQPDFFQYVFHSRMVPPEGANRGRYLNPEMDALIDRIMTELDADTRNALSVQVQQLQARDHIYLPLWRRDHLVLKQPYVKGYTPPLDGGYESIFGTFIERDTAGK
jgi:peptide/nickel transport system substrate-binding protein